jgi:hypothetical protein
MKRLFLVGALLVPSLASAHIHLTYPLSRTDNALGDPQKDEHCGTLTWDRAANASRVQTFAPGATITVLWSETINHQGWYRIAFQPNGEVFGIPPASTGPNGAGGASNYPTANQEGPDGNNNSIVLKDRIPDGTTSMQITLPNMECTNCTLQLIQVMTDTATYEPATDIYFNCSDIVLSAGAPDAGVPTVVDGGPTIGPDAGPGGNPEVSGGCSTGAGSSGLVLAFALVGLRRRRAR